MVLGITKLIFKVKLSCSFTIEKFTSKYCFLDETKTQKDIVFSSLRIEHFNKVVGANCPSYCLLYH